MVGKLVGDKFFVHEGGARGWREVTEKEWRKLMKPAPRSKGPCSLVGFKELHSDALGVHPKQIKEASEHAAKLGVPTEFDKLGRPIFTSRAHRKRYCASYGAFDKDGGYGDAAPGDVHRYRDVPKPLSGEELARQYFDA